MAGEYQSAFKGSGMEFDEVREYQPGDEVRSIDWNVTARQGHPYVKRFHEERELTVMFIVDLSASGGFGTCAQTKNELAAELCALLSFSAVKSNDKVGLIIFTDHVARFLPPGKGVGHAMRIISEVMGFSGDNAGDTNISDALEYFGKVVRKRCVAFMISDFQGEGYARQMRILAKKHDLIAVCVGDRREMDMPDVGLLELEDSETGEIVLIDTGSLKVRNSYGKISSAERGQLKTQFRSMNVDMMELQTVEDYTRKLVQFFRHREKK